MKAKAPKYKSLAAHMNESLSEAVGSEARKFLKYKDKWMNPKVEKVCKELRYTVGESCRKNDKLLIVSKNDTEVYNADAILDVVYRVMFDYPHSGSDIRKLIRRVHLAVKDIVYQLQQNELVDVTYSMLAAIIETEMLKVKSKLQPMVDKYRKENDENYGK